MTAFSQPGFKVWSKRLPVRRTEGKSCLEGHTAGPWGPEFSAGKWNRLGVGEEAFFISTFFPIFLVFTKFPTTFYFGC